MMKFCIAGDTGYAVRFPEETVRLMGRTAAGVRGINLEGGHVIGATLASEGDTILVLSENGFGKRSPVDEYRLSQPRYKRS